LQKGKHVEYDMILHMTEKDPKKRPSAQYIIETYLPAWKE